MENNSDKTDRLISLLDQIRDNQKIQIEKQAESMELQKEQFRMAQEQYEKSVKLQDRAEAIQEKSRALVEKSRKVFSIVLPLIFILIAYLTWLLIR